jgi:RNA polymerase sigma-70 factor (ECF subfamily)
MSTDGTARDATDGAPPGDEPPAPAPPLDARLARLLELHYRSVWRAVRRLGVPSGSAEDAAQEVFIIAARKLPSIEAEGEARYLYGIAVRVAANRRRSSSARHELGDESAVLAAVSSSPHPEALLEQKRMRELLDVALDALPDDLRAALVLFEIEGFSEREIAEICGVPLGTVASRLRRARQAFHRAAERLRQALAAKDEA